MTSWVVSIDGDHPNHWQIAKRSGFWDLSKERDIQQGDLVYFWQAGKSFLAKTRATTDAVPIAPGMPASWEDSGKRQYASRFEFEVLDEAPAEKPRWIKDVGPRLTGKTPDLRTIPKFDHPDDEHLLASYFSSSPVEKVLFDLLKDVGTEAEADMARLDLNVLTEDQREMVEKLVAMREGQSAFRRALLDVYPSCAVTGTTLEATLDAAHIAGYKGLQSNDVKNGLILRKDIHKLFDSHLLAIDADGRVRVAPVVTDPTYRDLDGQKAILPGKLQSQPDPGVLEAHRAKCTWLS